MRKQLFIIFLLIVSSICYPQVQAVCFADDHFTLYDDGEKITDRSFLIFSNMSGSLSFEEIYNGNLFVKSQSMITNLTFYRLNETNVLEYHTWIEANENASYLDYTTKYIQDLTNDSLYDLTVEIPDAEDTEIYNEPLFGVGGIIGRHRFFTIDLNDSTIELTETEIPESPGFQLFFFIIAIGIVFFMMKRKKK